MSFKITDIDLGWDALKATVQAMKGDCYVKAGVLEGKDRREDDKLGNVELAMIHEFGAPSKNIPERSFIREPFEAHKPEYLEQIKKACLAVVTGKGNFTRDLGLLGLRIVRDMQARITEGAGIPPPNAPATIEEKGSSRPLVDSGQLLRSITHAVTTPEGTK